MYHPRTRWKQRGAADETAAREIVKATGVHPMIAELFVRRGITSGEEAKRFMHITSDGFYDPFVMDGMEQAVFRIRQAIKQGEAICVYGDYDADGVTSTSLVVELFRLMGKAVDYYIPNRFTEGYGLNSEALKTIAEQGATLVITVDTGIAAVQEALAAKSLGIDLIITDHHEPPPEIPNALAVINPKKPGCPYPEKMLAGAGVALKLAHALLGRPPEELLPLAAVGTIADVVPLVGENRLIAALGLKKINERKHLGLTALLDASGLREVEVTAGHVGFVLGPRLNAAGRLDSAVPAVKLLTSDRYEDALPLAKYLDDQNRVRQQLVDQLTREAIAEVEADRAKHRHAIVVARAGWNIGVLGIVASRLVERFYRPAVVLGVDEATGVAKGSARSIDGFNLYEALTQLGRWLIEFGGHQGAAGLTLSAASVDAFRSELNAITAETLTADDFVPVTSVDVVCSVADIRLDWVEQLSLLEPFGAGNPVPCFHITGGQLKELKRVGQDGEHLRLSLAKDSQTVQVVAYQMGDCFDELMPGAHVDVVGELQVNEWNAHRSPQLVARDFRVPHVQVFDWRERKREKRDLEKLAERQAVFVCFTEESREWVEQQVQGTGARVYCWQEEKYPSACQSATDVVMVDYPVDTDSYYTLLRQLTQLERMYLLGKVANDRLVVPNRENFKSVYALLRHAGTFQPERDLPLWSVRTKIPPAVVSFILDVFVELGFAERAGQAVILKENAPKRSLGDSELLAERKKQAAICERFYYASLRELAQEILAVRGQEAARRPGGNANGFQTSDPDYSGLSPAGCAL